MRKKNPNQPGPKMMMLLECMNKNIHDKPVLLNQLYDVKSSSSISFKESASRNLNVLVNRMKKMGFDLVNDRKRIYYQEDC